MAQGHIKIKRPEKRRDGSTELVAVVRERELAELIQELVKDMYGLDLEILTTDWALEIRTDMDLQISDLIKVQIFVSGIQNCYNALSGSTGPARA